MSMSSPLDPDSTDWDALSTLLGAYLHQDFPEEHGSAWGAIRDFSVEAKANYILRTADQVQALLRTTGDEREAKEAVEVLGIDYVPTAEGWTYREWLTEVERFLRSEYRRRTTRA